MKDQTPPYFKWAWGRHKTKMILGVLLIGASVYATTAMRGHVWWEQVLALFPIYGATIGINYLPYNIYRKLVKRNHWNK